MKNDISVYFVMVFVGSLFVSYTKMIHLYWTTFQDYPTFEISSGSYFRIDMVSFENYGIIWSPEQYRKEILTYV